MKSIETIASDCGLTPDVAFWLRGIIQEPNDRKSSLGVTEHICIALYRRIEKLEEEKTPPRTERDLQILKMTEELEKEGELEFDDDAKISEGDDNGTYVQGWAWVSFAGTDLDKEKEGCDEQLPESICDDGSIAVQNPPPNFDHDPRFDEGGEFHEEANRKEESK